MSSSLSSSALAVERAPRKPPLLRVATPGDPAGWAVAHRDALRATVRENGVVLVRGLGLRDAAAVGAVFRGLAGASLMAERESFAPRQALGGGVYSSTKWPANQQMCMHHELSYTLEFPGTMMFACLTAPSSGGATTVADAPSVLGALPADLVARFEQEGWLLCRIYNEEIGAPWAEAFGTADPRAVEDYCRA